MSTPCYPPCYPPHRPPMSARSTRRSRWQTGHIRGRRGGSSGCSCSSSGTVWPHERSQAGAGSGVC